ncbi:MAG: hypothetical protein H7X88_04865 [Gloeobacteraceae cyanobacterium ES-bin-316]|nr:hypothetical protein [Ferruginibacter sp.]
MTTQNDNGKTAAIVGYITLIGWLISYFAIHSPNKTSLGSYHLRQTLLLMICAVVYQIVIMIVTVAMPFLGIFLSIGSLVFLVFWILGLISAINGEEKPIPLIGEKAQELFKNL